MKILFRGFLACIFIFLLSGAVFAQATVTDMQSQLEMLMKQVDAQKKQIESLQNTINEMQSKQAVPAAPAAAPEVKVSSKYDIKIYGKIKFDTIYDTNNMGRDEFITFVPQNADGKDKATFNVRDTRLGIAVTGPSMNGWTASGRFESDFYGSDPTSNGGLRIRLAYIDFKKDGTGIRVGQDWNQIAALNPTTVDFAIMGYNGNLWNRVPQVTLRQNFGSGLDGLLTVYRYRWNDDDAGSKVDTQIHMPWIGGKVAYAGKLIDPDKNAYIALDGAVRNGQAGDNDVTPYVAALELKLPIMFVELTGEAYMGQGLGSEYFHTGSGGAFSAKGNAVLTRGGFLQASVKPIKDITVNVGYGLDDPKNADAGSDFFQKSNYAFGNVFIQLFNDISAGVEVAHVNTDWATGDEHGTRYQASLMYNW